MEKTNVSPLETISMEVEMWLEFYNLFQKYVCVDSLLAVEGYIVFQKIGKRVGGKNLCVQTWPYIDLSISAVNQLLLFLAPPSILPPKLSPSQPLALLPQLFNNFDIHYRSPI